MGARRRLVLVVGVLLAVAFVNYSLIVEAFGSGPPHYGRTTNMDKWSDPRPALLALDVFALIAVAAIWKLVGRRRS